MRRLRTGFYISSVSRHPRHARVVLDLGTITARCAVTEGARKEVRSTCARGWHRSADDVRQLVLDERLVGVVAETPPRRAVKEPTARRAAIARPSLTTPESVGRALRSAYMKVAGDAFNVWGDFEVATERTLAEKLGLTDPRLGERRSEPEATRTLSAGVIRPDPKSEPSGR